MSGYEVKSFPLVEYRYGSFFESFNGWRFNDFRNDPVAYNDWIAFTTVMYCPADGLVHCGLTRFNNDILYTFDPGSREFKSLDYKSIAEKFEVKIHRSLVMHSDGYIYGATALLHDIDDTNHAPGGKLFRYRPRDYKIELLATPVPGSYIQSIDIDHEREMIYGFTFMPERMFCYDIRNARSRDLGLIGSCLFIAQAHKPLVDGSGTVWGTWGSYYSRDKLPTEGYAIKLLKFKPGNQHPEFLPFGLDPENGSTEMIDEAVTGPDGMLYFGTRSGRLYRFNPQTMESENLGRPAPYINRLAGIVFTSDGRMIISAGDKEMSRIFEYDQGRKEFIELCPVFDPARNVTAEKIHCLTLDSDRNTLYAGEIDNFRRSSYLWSIKLP